MQIQDKYTDPHQIFDFTQVQACLNEVAEHLMNEDLVQIQDKHTDSHQIFDFTHVQAFLTEAAELLPNDELVQMQGQNNDLHQIKRNGAQADQRKDLHSARSWKMGEFIVKGSEENGETLG